MATDDESLREHVLSEAVRCVPRSFFVEVHDRTRRAYSECYAEVAASRTTLREQRLSRLVQDRCFRMDWELFEAAKAHGLAVTAKELPSNKWRHAYAAVGPFGLTQAYVQRIGDLPQPARYRDELAEAARMPRLPLDDPSEIYAPRTFYALLAHNPVGRRFDEDQQRLGSLMFCVPHSDMKSYAVAIGVPELLARYPVEKKDAGRTALPTWKQQTKRDTGTE